MLCTIISAAARNVLALVFAEIQITACGIHCKVMNYAGAITNRELIASYVIISLFHGEEVFGHNASVNSKRQHPPLGIFKVVESPAPWQNFSAKARPPKQKSTYRWEYLRRSSQHFLLTLNRPGFLQIGMAGGGHL